MICIFAKFALAQDVFDYEVITMFAEGTVQMPPGSQTATIDEVTFDPAILKTILIDHTAVTISMAFPDYNPADSLIESPRFPGLLAKQARLDHIYRIKLTDRSQRDLLNAKLKGYDEVYFSDNNGEGETDFEPNDAFFPLQWGMHNDEDNFDIPDADVNAPDAWDISQGNPTTVIGIIDEGVYQGHIEFQGRISGEGPGDTDHGTHVAGIAAAEGNNNQEGVAGITWNSLIYSKDVSYYDAVDIYESVIDAITYGGVDVLNNSWSGPHINSLIHQAMAIAHELGVLVVAARGNRSNDIPRYPACYPDGFVLSVGAFNHLGDLSDFSSYGAGMDLLAPGGNRDGPSGRDIYSTWGRSGNQYAYLRGTSMAAPHVSGMVGLLDFYNQLPAFGDNFIAVICSTAVDIYADGYDDLSGYGRLNARAALDFISQPNRIFTCDASGGVGPYIHYQSPDWEPWAFIGSRDLADGTYLVKQYEIWYDASYLA
jgi:subtilisin family serine protease